MNFSRFVFVLLVTLVAVSCKKEYTATIGSVEGYSQVCYGEKQVPYSIVKDSKIDYILWTVPEGAQIESGQGTDSIKVNFGVKHGSVCASFYKDGERVSGVACVDVTFGFPGKWCKIPDFKGGKRYAAVGFVIAGNAYVGTGREENFSKNDIWSLDPITNTWSGKNNFVSSVRYHAISFSIGNKGYFGTGFSDGDLKKDFWEYDPTSDSWQQKAALATARQYAFAFAIGNKGYVGGGAGPTSYLSDFQEYNPVTNEWVAKANLPGPRVGAAAFVINTKGYMVAGYETGYRNDLWEYNPADTSNGWDTNNNPLGKWTAKAPFPGTPRYLAVAFSIDTKGYMGSGCDQSVHFKDFYQYDPGPNTWQTKDSIPGVRAGAIGFSIGNKGYVGTGFIQGSSPLIIHKDFWVYTQE